MDKDRPTLLPSNDLGDFFANKLSTGLAIIDFYKKDIQINKFAWLNIDAELNEIYIQIKYRLKRYEHKDLMIQWKKTNKTLYGLKPYIKKHKQDSENNRVATATITKDFTIFKGLIKEKQALIYECLDRLGLFGKVEKQSKRLR